MELLKQTIMPTVREVRTMSELQAFEAMDREEGVGEKFKAGD